MNICYLIGLTFGGKRVYQDRCSILGFCFKSSELHIAMILCRTIIAQRMAFFNFMSMLNDILNKSSILGVGSMSIARCSLRVITVRLSHSLDYYEQISYR